MISNIVVNLEKMPRGLGLDKGQYVGSTLKLNLQGQNLNLFEKNLENFRSKIAPPEL